ncbi:MAG TPA: hypothetical protein VFK47_20655, partial [Ktedonobacteraceae bacterium]|nr:hypothetical protein [Ktedonobacteraceae bacterium]
MRNEVERLSRGRRPLLEAVACLWTTSQPRCASPWALLHQRLFIYEAEYLYHSKITEVEGEPGLLSVVLKWFY